MTGSSRTSTWRDPIFAQFTRDIAGIVDQPEPLELTVRGKAAEWRPDDLDGSSSRCW